MSEQEELEPDMELREALCFCADVHDCPTEADSDRLRAACDAHQEAVLTLLHARDDRIRAEALERAAEQFGEHQRKLTRRDTAVHPYSEACAWLRTRAAALRVAAGTPTHHTTEEDTP